MALAGARAPGQPQSYVLAGVLGAVVAVPVVAVAWSARTALRGRP